MGVFVRPNDKSLSPRAKQVAVSETTSDSLNEDIERMLHVAFNNQNDRAKSVMVGIAAPQIGINRRIAMVDVRADGHGVVGDLRIYINPEIVWMSHERSEWYEGCYSTDRVCGVVERPNKIRVMAVNQFGDSVEEAHSGYVARIFQYEVDHLNGVEFTAHITEDSKLHWVEPSEFPKYRDLEGWRNWQALCSRDRWNKIKRLSA